MHHSLNLSWLVKTCLVWSLPLSDMLLTRSLNHVVIKLKVMRLLLFFSCFPGNVAQVAASCVAQCGQKCKELKTGGRRRKDWKSKHKENRERLKVNSDILKALVTLYWERSQITRSILHSCVHMSTLKHVAWLRIVTYSQSIVQSYTVFLGHITQIMYHKVSMALYLCPQLLFATELAMMQPIHMKYPDCIFAMHLNVQLPSMFYVHTTWSHKGCFTHRLPGLFHRNSLDILMLIVQTNLMESCFPKSS